MKQSNKLASGWAFEAHLGAYHFEHVPIVKADALMQARECLYVVETINHTLADGNKKAVHFNQYFAIDFSAAIALAAQIEISAQQVAETAIGIRPATESEVGLYWRVSDHYNKQLPHALSDEAAKSL